MAKREYEKLMVAGQILEVRHVPSGSFLDVRGYVADYVRASKFLPHWKIDASIVTFRDKPEKVDKEGAFAGYQSVGYLVNDPETRNLFIDRASLFWRTIQKNQHYRLPDLERFGARTKVFLPSAQSFDEINSGFYRVFYTDTTREIIGGTEKDVQFVIELKEEDFDVRVSGGPIHKGEVGAYLGFESKQFENAGFFVDLDFYRTSGLKHDDVPRLLRAAVDLTWSKVERLASAIGI
jgi:hypothetical protein